MPNHIRAAKDRVPRGPKRGALPNITNHFVHRISSHAIGAVWFHISAYFGEERRRVSLYRWPSMSKWLRGSRKRPWASAPRAVHATAAWTPRIRPARAWSFRVTGDRAAQLDDHGSNQSLCNCGDVHVCSEREKSQQSCLEVLETFLIRSKSLIRSY